MSKKCAILTRRTFLGALGAAVWAPPVQSEDCLLHSTPMPVGVRGVHKTWGEICDRYPWLGGDTGQRITLDGMTMRKIYTAYSQVDLMPYEPDPAGPHGTLRDVWTPYYEPGRGFDCEDRVLYLMTLLIKAGMPAGALRVLVVGLAPPVNDAHAVLNLVSDRGDYVVDPTDSYFRPLQIVTPWTRYKVRYRTAEPRIVEAVGERWRND